MGEVTLNLPSYTALGLVTLNLLIELLTKCGLGPHTPCKQFRKLIAGRNQGRSVNRNYGCDQHIFAGLPKYYISRIRPS